MICGTLINSSWSLAIPKDISSLTICLQLLGLGKQFTFLALSTYVENVAFPLVSMKNPHTTSVAFCKFSFIISSLSLFSFSPLIFTSFSPFNYEKQISKSQDFKGLSHVTSTRQSYHVHRFSHVPLEGTGTAQLEDHRCLHSDNHRCFHILPHWSRGNKLWRKWRSWAITVEHTHCDTNGEKTHTTILSSY